MNDRIIKRFIAVLTALVFVFCLVSCSKPDVQTFDADTVQLPIIMYHSMLKDKSKSSKFVITPGEFEQDLIYIKEHGFTTVTISDLIAYVYNDKPLPQKPIMITFDDGYLNTYSYAYPLLKKYDMKAVLSILGFCTEQDSKNAIHSLYYSHVTWKEINEMIASGYIEIQNHSYNLHKINNERRAAMIRRGESVEHYEQVLSDDIGKLQKIITEQTGYTPTAFTYPYGFISDESVSIMKKLGFLSTISCDEGVNLVNKNPDCLFGLKRYNRPHGMSTGKFFKKRLLTRYVE